MSSWRMDHGPARIGFGPARIVLLFGFALLAAILAGCSRSRPIGYSDPAERPSMSTAAEPSLSELVPAQSLPARGEELWIIEKASPVKPAAATDPTLSPGSGMLLGIRGVQLTPFPLEHTEVHADVHGCIASVDVRQRFTNPSHEPAETAYVFPLPQNAAVTEFVMTVGRRHIRGIVRERGEAEKIYREAHALGFLVSLMVQQGPDVFVQRVANIEPGRQIDVDIRYFHTVPFRDGWFEFNFPLIAGPRGSGWPKAGQRSGRDIDLAIHLDPGGPIERVESPSHALFTTAPGGKTADVTLAPADRIANTDFVLRYKLADVAIKPSLVTEPDGDGGAFALFLAPPGNPADLPRRPLEMIFAIDSGAGSAGAVPVARALRSLKAEDTFEIVHTLGMSAHSMTAGRLPATPENVARFMDAVGNVRSTGAGTGEILRAALSVPHDQKRTRIVCLVTDGRPSARDALAASAQLLGAARIIAVGVGRDPDKDAIDSIARMGRGAAVYPPPGEDPGPTMADLIDLVSHPALLDIAIDDKGANIFDVYPRRIPDLFAGHAVLLTGRYHGTPPTALTLRGTTAVGPGELVVAATPIAPAGRSPVASVWARMKIADLASQAAYQPNALLPEQIKQVALDYGLLSRYTAVVCVDSLTRTSTANASPPAPMPPVAGGPK
ncbi:MAG: marine proteobacterial sortase target protein [Phycisphaerales bacterium]|nr:marine proteobacterial sortase target protein [Phycisphaerales bacterium]